MVVVVLVYQLEVLDASLVHAAVEIKNERLHLFVPLRRLVEEKHNLFDVVLLKLLLNRVVRILRVPRLLRGLVRHIGQKHFHAPRSFTAKHICLVLYHALLRADIRITCYTTLCLGRVKTCIEDRKFSS